jgi:hypothetical protein
MTERQDAWIAALLGGAKVVDEPLATCATCVMLDPPPGAVRFGPSTKCCTWMPQLPNFLAGAVLDVPSVVERIETGVAVTPVGLGVPRAYFNLHGMKEATFGKAALLRCPHLIGDGRCGIWAHRQSTCATWFCRYERGRAGADFWAKVHKLLAWMEWGVARWAAKELGFDDATLDVGAPHFETVGSIDLDRHSQPELYAGVWGAWAGRERELYAETARLARGITLDEALARGSLRTRIYAEDVRQAWAGLQEPPPVLVRLGTSWRVVHEDTDRVVFEAYSEYDPIVLHPSIFQKLPRFDGRPLAEVLAENPDIDARVARRLIDVGILESASAHEAAE